MGRRLAAISLVGDLIKVCAAKPQVIVAIHSPLRVDVFDVDEILIFEAQDGKSCVSRRGKGKFREWLSEYTTG